MRHCINTWHACPEWVWRCRVRGYLLRAMAVFFALVSVVVVWSELTFFSTNPTISLFAVFVNLAKANYDYFTIEVRNLSSCKYL